MATNPFRSDRLIYRAIETPADDDFLRSLSADPFILQNSSVSIVRPQSAKDVEGHIKFLTEEALLGVVISLPAAEPQGKPIPIGCIDVSWCFGAKRAHHRCAMIGIQLLEGFQGQGYGSEAIRWVLDWCFDAAGLHKVVIGAFEWNYGARRLYERLGFKTEGVRREMFWHKGRFWDDYEFGILGSEWREMKAKDGKAK